MRLLSGNEAIARGAYEAGVGVAAAYPGTPSTEILQNIARHYPAIYAEWAPNEKVAIEVGIGASLGGARVLVAMKHVGVNVAADPLVTLSYTGVNAGLVLISADDPGMHSSQNEQDNRYYARLAETPLIEPADSQEAKDFVRFALELSETYDVPVILRTTTRVAHSKSLVQESEPVDLVKKPYEKDFTKYVMVPANARVRHSLFDERRERLRQVAERTPLNRIEKGDGRIGIITSGIAYYYVKEAFPWASVLKLGMSQPLPSELIRAFARQVERLFVVEELEPFLEEQVAALRLSVRGKELIPRTGELSPAVIRRFLMQDPYLAEAAREHDPQAPAGAQEEISSLPHAPLPARPPVLCPGCPHRGLFYVLKKLGLRVMGDIGCYTLGSLPPLSAMDTCICMGAGVGMVHGMAKADPDSAVKTVAVIGDSTFIHSGITGLIDIVYNQGASVVIIADNRTTAMTGHQDHPGTGKTLRREPVKALNLAKLARAAGVPHVFTVDPFDLAATKRTLQKALRIPEPVVVISSRPCILLSPVTPAPVPVNPELCRGCKLCLQIGCPALSYRDRVIINPHLCVGCGLCAQVCRKGAIGKEGEK
ncbi:MAG: indolepyruvate ferredoxin oxidoreductase subunit alpha [Bacillota bacterium]